MKQLFFASTFLLCLCSSGYCALIDSSATNETVALYQKLVRASGTAMYFGQHFYDQDPVTGTHNGVFLISGKTPSLAEFAYKIGWEVDPAQATFNDANSVLMEAHHARGGFVGISFIHANMVTNGAPTDVGGDCLTNILPGGSKRTEYLNALSTLGDWLNNLKDANGNPIPVIVRPYHENDGWWGWFRRFKGTITAFSDAGGGKVSVASTANKLVDGQVVTISGTTNYNGDYTISSASTNSFSITATWVANDGTSLWTIKQDDKFIQLWQDFVTYLRDTKGVHNAIYCYAPELYPNGGSKVDFTIRYPGNDYVDIIGIDQYPDVDPAKDDDGTVQDAIVFYRAMYDEAFSRGKLFAITEGLRDLDANPLESFWTDYYLTPILNDSKVSKASYIATWFSPWGADVGRVDTASFLEASQNSRLIFTGDCDNPIHLENVRLSDTRFILKNN